MRKSIFPLLYLAFLFLILPRPAFALILKKCGTYHVEGRFKLLKPPLSPGNSHSPQKVLVTDQESESQITFELVEPSAHQVNPLLCTSTVNPTPKRKVSPCSVIPTQYADLNVEVELKVSSACDFRCQGQVIRFVKLLSPFQKPSQFLRAGLKPVDGTEIQCGTHKKQSEK